MWAVASNGGRQRPGHEDRDQDIDPRPVAPDHPDRSAIRAGRVLTGQQKLELYVVKYVTARWIHQSFEKQYVLRTFRAFRLRAVPL